ncbi:MAG: hypothetical protein K0R51_3362 [Cytophagaceae bacterium]|jgi:hypothetical protein|nr:hypothetical protein [Cytophagaceae bacterium]
MTVQFYVTKIKEKEDKKWFWSDYVREKRWANSYKCLILIYLIYNIPFKIHSNEKN